MKEYFPIGWAILSTVLLSQGRETDAEKAGKRALDQCADLKMTWPKLRSIMFSHGIEKGKDWKSPRRVRFEISETSQWGIILSKLSESGDESLEGIVSIVEEEGTTAIESKIEVVEEIGSTVEEEDTTITESKIETIKAKDSHLDAIVEKRRDIQLTDGKSAEFWFSKARVHLTAHDFEKAEEALMRGLAIDPENGEALLRVGIILMKRGAHEEAEDALRLANKHLPENPETWLKLGICLQAREKWKESAEFLKVATEKDPKNVEAWVKLGEADYYRSMYQSAARSFLRALRLLPNHVYALFYLGRCMEYRGNETHALRVYRKLLNLEPNNPEILRDIQVVSSSWSNK